MASGQSKKPIGGKRYKVILSGAFTAKGLFVLSFLYRPVISCRGAFHYFWTYKFRIQLKRMLRLNKHYRLTLWTTIISLAGLVAVMLSTNPIEKIIYAVLFFGLALIFLISAGHLIVRLQLGDVNTKNRYRIIAISLIILTLLMFRSAQSLNWVDAVILILISFGLVFYVSRRS